jgi:hypothetical protein
VDTHVNTLILIIINVLCQLDHQHLPVVQFKHQDLPAAQPHHRQHHLLVMVEQLVLQLVIGIVVK